MKITIITACYNSIATIGDAIESVRRQKLPDGVELEHLIIDGGSTDGCEKLATISERDKGLYDALNKGIRKATGDVVGICNADDVLANDDVVAKIAAEFLTQRHGGTETQRLDVVYGDVRFVKGESSCVAAPQKNSVPPCPCASVLKSTPSNLDLLRNAPVTRYCTGRFFKKWMFRFATFPAHPSTFVRKACFEQAGYYSLDYRICADFEFMLRLFCKCRVRSKYLPLCTHVMRAGGMSTNGVRSNMQINQEDLRALKANGYWACLPMLYLKYPFKVLGILFRNLYMR